MLYKGCSLSTPSSFPPSLPHSSAPRSPRPQALHKEVLCKFAIMLPSCEMSGQGDPKIVHLEDVYRRYIRCEKQGSGCVKQCGGRTAPHALVGTWPEA